MAGRPARAWERQMRGGQADGLILTPRCPLPMMTFGTQAFCGNDDCTLLNWTPTLSLDDNLLNAGVVRFPPMDGDEGEK